MGGPGSGGRNRLSSDEHRRRGTFRRDRHARQTNRPVGVVSLSVVQGKGGGAQLIDEVTAAYDLTPGELVILRQAAHTLDELARMQSLMARSSPVSVGSANQPVPHPLLAELRQHRVVLQALLKQLRIEVVAASQSEPVIQLTRWQKEHGR
jgi:hypothetical protein